MAAFINPLSWFDKFPQNEKEILMLRIKRKTFPKTMRISSSIFSIWVYIFVECRNSCRDWLINVIQVEFQLWLELFLNSQIFFGCTFAINSQMTSSLLPEIMFMLTDIDNVNAKNHSAQKKTFLWIDWALFILSFRKCHIQVHIWKNLQLLDPK